MMKKPFLFIYLFILTFLVAEIQSSFSEESPPPSNVEKNVEENEPKGVKEKIDDRLLSEKDDISESKEDKAFPLLNGTDDPPDIYDEYLYDKHLKQYQIDINKWEKDQGDLLKEMTIFFDNRYKLGAWNQRHVREWKKYDRDLIKLKKNKELFKKDEKSFTEIMKKFNKDTKGWYSKQDDLDMRTRSFNAEVKEYRKLPPGGDPTGSLYRYITSTDIKLKNERKRLRKEWKKKFAKREKNNNSLQTKIETTEKNLEKEEERLERTNTNLNKEENDLQKAALVLDSTHIRLKKAQNTLGIRLKILLETERELEIRRKQLGLPKKAIK